MSGHSKWAKIKRAKGANDVKKGALFTKLAKNITLAAKEAGGDMDTNFALRLAVDKAKQANMPADNIDRAVKKGTGALAGEAEIKEISYEAFGVKNVSIIIDCQTDNSNRTVADVKKILESHGGKMAEIGSVGWKFSEKGKLTVIPAKFVKSEKYGQDDYYAPIAKEDAEMELFEIAGIEDIVPSEFEREDGSTSPAFEVYTAKADFAATAKAIHAAGLQIQDAELIKLSQDKTELDAQSYEKHTALLDALDENDDVSNVWDDVH